MPLFSILGGVMVDNPRIPYKFDVEAIQRLTRLPNPPIEDIEPNSERSIADEGVLIAFKAPKQYLKWFTSCIETSADVLWRDNQDLAQQIKDAWFMATEYPLPIDSLDSLEEIDNAARQLTLNITNNNLQSLRNTYYQSNQNNTSIFPNAPATMPNVASTELDELCAAVYTFIAYSLDELSDAVSDVLGVPRLLTKLGKALGLKGLVASILIKVGSELLETITDAAINNQDNLDALSCIMLANLRGQGLNAGNFGRSLDVAPLSDPIQEAVRAVLSVNIKQVDAYIAFLDVYRQADTTPFSALPICPCDVGWSQTFDFTLGQGGWQFEPAMPPNIPIQGEYVTNVGIRSVRGTGVNTQLMFLQPFINFSATVIRQVRLEYFAPQAGGSGNVRQLQIAGIGNFNMPQTAESNGIFTVNVNGIATSIRFVYGTIAPSGVTPLANIFTRLVVSGEGVNPFI